MRSFFRPLSLAGMAAVGGLLVLTGCSAPSGSASPESASVANLSTVAKPAPLVESSSSSASDSANSESKEDKIRALLAGASHGQVNLDHTFKGPDGMIGAVTTSGNGAKSIAFISPNAKVIFPSGGFDISGQNITQKYLYSEGVYISPTQLAKEVKSRGFIVGKKGPLVTMFSDPNCYWCHKSWQDFTPMIEAGKMRIRVLLVGIIKPTSTAKSVAILTAADKWKALKKDELHFDVKHESGDAPTDKTDPKAAAKVKANEALMAKAGQMSTPGFLYCKKGQKEPVYINGSPQDPEQFLADLDASNPLCQAKK